MGKLIIMILILSVLGISIGTYMYFDRPLQSTDLSFIQSIRDSIFSKAISHSPTNSKFQLRLDKYQGLEKFLITNQSWEFKDDFDNETNITTENLHIDLTINRTVFNFMKDAYKNPTLAKCRIAEPYIQEDYPNFDCY